MAVETTMEITMALGSFFRFISLVLLLVPATGARYLTEGASTTSSGLMPMDGTSPRPTRAPDWNRGLNDLRRRADSIISPAPSNWCGLIDGDYTRPMSCGVATSCVFKGGYAKCCTELNTASCFTDMPTTCLDSSSARLTIIRTLSIACLASDVPFCQTATFSGTNSIFYCGSTSVSRVHSLKLLSEFYSTALKTASISSSRTPPTTPSTTPSSTASISSRISSTTPSTTPSTTSSVTPRSTSSSPLTSSPETVATTIITSLHPSTPSTETIAPTVINPNAITSSPAALFTTPAARLPTPAVAGIGLGAGLLISGAIAGVAIFLWRKRNRARANPDGHNPDVGNTSMSGGSGPAMAQTNNNIANGYQNVGHPGSQYVSKSEPPDFIKVPEQPASPPHYSPAPIYTSGQYTSPPLIPSDSDNRTSNISQYPTPASTPLPLLGATTGNSPAELYHQQTSTATSLRDYPPNSPISELGPGEAAAGSFSTPRNYAHEVAGAVPAYFNNARNSAQPLQGIHEAPNQVEPRYEAYSPAVGAPRSSMASPTPTHTQTQAHGVGGQAFSLGEGSPAGQQPQQREAGARPVEMG